MGKHLENQMGNPVEKTKMADNIFRFVLLVGILPGMVFLDIVDVKTISPALLITLAVAYSVLCFIVGIYVYRRRHLMPSKYLWTYRILLFGLFTEFIFAAAYVWAVLTHR